MNNKRNRYVYLVYIAINFIIYYPVLDNAFISDDYDSLYRIHVEKTILIKEFFRPMIDLSFYLNFLVSKLNPWSYYLLNIIIHISNVILVYQLVLNYGRYIKKDIQTLAFFSGFLFMIYPFHNEGIIWLTGRLASIACMFGLLSINAILLPVNRILKISLAVAFYFLGLLAYESILFLPFIVIVFCRTRSKALKSVLREIGLALIIMAAYLVVRWTLSGTIYGTYGERMYNWSIKSNIVKLLKVFGRAVLPPAENASLLTALFVGMILLLTTAFWLTTRSSGYMQSFKGDLFKSGLAFIIAMAIPVFFGISTRTTEGDRLLYFPSVFLAIFIANWLFLLKKRIFRNFVLSAIALYFLFFLFSNNRRWEKASHASDSIISEVKNNNNKEIVIINLPDELEGAFVFRNGFYKALLLNGIDTGRVVVNNYLTRLQYLGLEGKIKADSGSSLYSILPVTHILPTGDSDSLIIVNTLANTQKMVSSNAVLYFWDKCSLQRVNN